MWLTYILIIIARKIDSRLCNSTEQWKASEEAMFSLDEYRNLTTLIAEVQFAVLTLIEFMTK